MSTNNAIPPLEERIRARLAAAKTLSSASRHTAELSISQTAIKPVRLLHLWEDRVTNARTDEVLFTISSAPRQTRHIFLRPGIVVATAATNEQICTIRFGTRKTSSFRITALPDRREVKISNTRRRWAFTPTDPATATTAASTATTTTDPKAVSSSSSISTTTTTTKQPVWIWQRDTTGGTSPSVILIEDKEQKTHTLAARRVLARISVNLLSFPSLDSITADSWLEIVMTAIGLAQHVRNWCKYGGTLEGAGGIVMIFDGGCGGDGGSGGGDGGGGCGGDGGGGGGGGGGGDGGS